MAGTDGSELRLAVIDCGSNSFRLVVFTARDGWWKLTDEIHEAVRVGEGLEATGELQPEPMERALEVLELYAHFCRATGIEDVRPVATSAIRDARNQAEFLRLAKERTGLDVQVLPGEEEGRFGYLAAINSTTLTNGVTLDLGGGSMQLTLVEDRKALTSRSWPMGAVRMTERFLPDEEVKGKQIDALREHVRGELDKVPWLGGGGELTGIGGSVRNLAAAAQLQEGLPSHGIQGFVITRKALGTLIEELADLPAHKRDDVPGIKANRADLILAAALVVEGVMDAGGFKELQATEAGLREGVFFDALLADHDPPLFEDVRRATVHNLAAQYDTDFKHAEHVRALALEIWDALGEALLHPRNAGERELVEAAALLHDIGMAVDYDDHHKHSRYLILSADLPGFTPREAALIAQACRYHRKGSPQLGEFEPVAEKGDDALLDRVATVLRIAEHLERARDQTIRSVQVDVGDEAVTLRLESGEDTTMACWAAMRQASLFERAFGRELEVV